ncbi:hypothetical protein WJX81_005958 [Elliptochloris bilobata]|uniref:Uncharacterized protein n=1 Tax=Elliptochloris bilobata TaxID=381761 RepID=A0AAW1RZQ8_9CHLO
MVVATAALGFAIGTRAPEGLRTAGKAAGAVVGAAAGAAAARKLQEERVSVAGAVLHNLLVEQGPGRLQRADVAGLADRMGIDFGRALVDELKAAYDAYLQAVLPPGDAPLKGDEAEKLRAFKDALGLADEDAAPVHIDAGRRLMRSRLEAGSRGADFEQRRALQKLIYVSTLVFGDQKAAFLLPWRRVFGMSDAQLYIARRDNAKALFRSLLEARGGGLPADRGALAEVRAAQQRVRLEDDAAAEAVKEAARATAESMLDRGLECLKRRTRVRDHSDALQAVWEVLSYSRALASLAGDPELPPGLGPVSVYGGRLNANGTRRDLRELYRVYLEETLRRGGRFSEQLERDAVDSQKVLGLGVKEAREMRDDIVSKAYRRLLREEFTSGRLDAAASKAAVLGELCERLGFDAEAAAALHRQLYRERLEALLAADKRIDDKGAEELDRLRRLLCIKRADVQQIQREICGRVYQQVVEDAMNAGIERFGFADREAVRRSQRDLRLEPALAREVLSNAARKAFQAYIGRSRNKRDRLEAAKELKGLVFFSNIVVAALLEDVQKDEAAAAKDKAAAAEDAQKAIADMMVQAQAQMAKDTSAAEPDASGAEAAAEEEESADDARAAALEEAMELLAQARAEAARGARGRNDAEDQASEATAASAEDVAEAAEASAQAEAATVASDGKAPATLRKSQEAAAKCADGEEVGSTGVVMRSQKEITLKEDLDVRDRLDIYRNFLLYCMSGDVVALPMGSTVVVERDASEFARLSQLGDILGLNPLEISSVHSQLAEQAFRNQVQQAIGGGASLTKEKADYLSEMREKMGLSKEAAEKVIKGVQNQHLISGLQASKATGALTLQKVLDMKDAGVEVSSFVSEELRANLYAQELAKVLGDGSGDFDAERYVNELPRELGLPQRRATAAVEALTKDRKRTVLVQAISFLRQRKLAEAVKALNNLLAANKALPSERPVQWDAKEELSDLFSVYVGREHSHEKQAAMQHLLGLPDSDANALKDLVASGSFKLEQDAEEEASFF